MSTQETPGGYVHEDPDVTNQPDVRISLTYAEALDVIEDGLFCESSIEPITTETFKHNAVNLLGLLIDASADLAQEGAPTAGYTRPRTITTVAELQKLGNGAVILDVDGDVSQRRAGQWCGYETAPLSDRKVSIFLPATVLHDPSKGGAV